jgi:hypothetical protein
MRSGLMFTLPFFLLLIVRNINAFASIALIALYLSADTRISLREGFWSNRTPLPTKRADVIRNGLAVDSHGSFYEPLVEMLGNAVRVIP